MYRRTNRLIQIFLPTLFSYYPEFYYLLMIYSLWVALKTYVDVSLQWKLYVDTAEIGEVFLHLYKKQKASK